MKKIRKFLIFFCVVSVVSCRQPVNRKPPELQYRSGEAVAVTFQGQAKDSYRIYRSGEQITPVLGHFTSEGNHNTFSPVLPFTPGLSYVIRAGKDSISGFTVPTPLHQSEPAQLSAIYPLQDTVPENLLKVYLQFSAPMQGVGNALDYIDVLENDSGEKISVFLDLEAELWDARHTRLTLWLDPGRIKKGLIPNRNLGVPLVAGRSYTITISGDWRAANGVALGTTYRKTLVVVGPDRQKPEARHWEIQSPRAGLIQPLELIFKEPMDMLMAVDACRISNAEGEVPAGVWENLKDGSGLQFTPSSPWEAGKYSVWMDSGTEDLAGNTFRRLFDTDLERGEATTSADSVSRSFLIAD